MRRFAERYATANGKPGARAGTAADAPNLRHLARLRHRDRKMAQAQLDNMRLLGVRGVCNVRPGKHAGLDAPALTTLVSRNGV
jgi:hypothetical protein